MMTKFWEKIGENFANEWNFQTLLPAFLFWGGAALVLANKFGWQWLYDLQQTDTITLVIALIIVIFILLISSNFVKWITLPVLKILEGYWPNRFWRIRTWLTKRINSKVGRMEMSWSSLAGIVELDLGDAKKHEQYIRLDTQLDNYPVAIKSRMPTLLGNILRAAEEYPNRVFGLEVYTTWPRLWMCLSEEFKSEINNALKAIYRETSLFIWGFAFTIWGYWNFWAIVVAVIIVVAAYARLCSAAITYGQIVRSAYDLNRFLLYDILHWPTPSDPKSEKTSGEILTIYLKRNFYPDNILFDHQEK